ncbi:hypothetical protein CABS01_16493 [Colletotrichum abscissum]|uniref:Uncharacterized protein n=1 Tax=Colletotrichum abscissum TaxID=1671311 RepID=A0A9P9X416_9PEZI|nr:uncharacterized protein CABS01_16493 [Colletotrichum abscissum]KAI3534612.1 hypothetical protein CABS02_13193 [Colletotrichum abscissum]KAK1521612.1 hypothetical protein CABS01_16493 [Colletotrichum abscissum]
MAAPQHMVDSSLDDLTPGLVTLVIDKVGASINYCRAHAAAQDETIRRLAAEINSARTTGELQLKTLDNQGAYIRSLEHDMAQL